VGPDKAKAWFLALDKHPEWYQFESHAGFTFTEGEFGEPGARFQTEETFLGIRQRLKFELTEVNANRFTFYLREPIRAVWGYFELEPTSAGDTRLRLAIGSDKAMQRLFLKLPGVRTAVQRQITREVEHIKVSMEDLTSRATAVELAPDTVSEIKNSE
jgi:hypothetical protein